ncbi:hypothetical protein JCM24511_01974 [Saitozyma sp. JCM 24511]|nr:hypothetical protein JCM24511_01974 [Saitozyma sp. JCM 24511]
MAETSRKDIESAEKGLELPGAKADVIATEARDDNLDVAGKYLAEILLRPDATELLAESTPEEERTVVRKADMIIIPLLLVALMMGAVDKNALSTAAVLGLRTDLKLVGQQYAWCGSLIFFGSLTSLFPALFTMQRFPAGKVVAINVTIWGIIAMSMAASKDFGGLAAARFVLGLFEALTFPGFSLIISSWYTHACSFVTDQLLVSAWQLLFLLVGAITLSWGMLMGLLLPDSPVKARWLTERQRVVAVMRLKANRTGVENKVFKVSQVVEAFLDLKTWLMFLLNICLNVPNGGVSTFNSIIVSSLGFTTRQTTLLSIPTGLISWVGSLVFAWIAVKTKQRCLTALVSCFIPLLSTILLHVIPRSNKGGSLGSLFIIYFYWAPYVVMMTVVNANTGGYTKKTVVYGMAYAGYLVGNIVGPQTFQASQAPAYTGGVVAMLVCYCVAILASLVPSPTVAEANLVQLILMYYLNVVRLNRSKEAWRNAHAAELAEQDLLDEWHDETDFQSRRFVYVL